MKLLGKLRSGLGAEALDFVNLYTSLGERSENFIPPHISERLKKFAHLCTEFSVDPALQNTELERELLGLKDAIPGYAMVSLMLYPTQSSKAFIYNESRQQFLNRLNEYLDSEQVDGQKKQQLENILASQDYSIGTPPVTEQNIRFRNAVLLGEDVTELRKFRDVIGINGDIEEAQWNYFMDVLDQMVLQSSHYTTKKEKEHFLLRSEATVNFKGLNGFIRTFVSGTAETVVSLLSGDVFAADAVKVFDYKSPEELFEMIRDDHTSIFAIKVQHARRNLFTDTRWFPYLSRMVIIDDSPESRSTNTSLVFCFHNRIINLLNNVHTKKLGALANSQTNLRLILDKVNETNLEKFRECAQAKIEDYESELNELKVSQVGVDDDPDKDLALYKFDEFARQIIKDKFALSKLRDYIDLILDTKSPAKISRRNKALVHEFEQRTKKYYYSDNEEVHVAAILEGGGRNQIRTFGKYLIKRKLKPVPKAIVNRCKTILDVVPNTYERTLHHHFHKNFGLNLFLERYKEYITKVENEADNRGRFENFLIDLGILDVYNSKEADEQKQIREFVSGLSILNQTTVADDVQMIIRDLFDPDNRRPYVIFNQDSSWEYTDLFPSDRFDINPFDLTVELTEEGRIAYSRLEQKLGRMRATFQLFDDTGNLWDRFCDNLTVIINDPSNPSGYSDFNSPDLISFLRFLNKTRITLFLDEAYNDAVRLKDTEEPKWRTISRYIMNNSKTFAKISAVSSLSTTKNLGATGSRLGSLVATSNKKDVIEFAKEHNRVEKGNTNSLYMLVNVLETAQLAKKIKDVMEERLPRNASRFKIKGKIEQFIKDEIAKRKSYENVGKRGSTKIGRYSEFEGSPLHIYLLNELSSLDKLDVLDVPDDFKFKGEPFFSHYKKHIVSGLNAHRVNKNFRSEVHRRYSIAHETAVAVIAGEENAGARIIESDGSFLFNILLTGVRSYHDLERFTLVLARERGVAVIPYKTGAVRFSLGGYLTGDARSYSDFGREFENSLRLFLHYWRLFREAQEKHANKLRTTDHILNDILGSESNRQFIDQIIDDYNILRDIRKQAHSSLRISDIKSIYYAFSADCGVNINSIGNSSNAVIEFYEQVGNCRNVIDFIRSKAFSKIYENLLPQIYKRIPSLKYLNIHEVLTRFGKPAILKYIKNKLDYQPTTWVLDHPEELLTMREILLEMENTLFSDAKFKILALKAGDHVPDDLARLEGYNNIIRKYIREILLLFNLPFEQEAIVPTIQKIVAAGLETFEEVSGIRSNEIDLEAGIQHVLNTLSNSLTSEFPIELDFLKGKLDRIVREKLAVDSSDVAESITHLFLMNRENRFETLFKEKLADYQYSTSEYVDVDMKLMAADISQKLFEKDIHSIFEQVHNTRFELVEANDLQKVVRDVTHFIINLVNWMRGVEYYDRYTHVLFRFTIVRFIAQNSSINEMIQHGITLHTGMPFSKKLVNFNKGSISWIHDIMNRCGVIASEQPVQIHTRMVTDAKKRVFPIHKVDSNENISLDLNAEGGGESFIKFLKTRPTSSFFNKRMAKFVGNLDPEDYRCKVITDGFLQELVVFQKSYMKFLADNYRLLQYSDVRIDDLKDFVPDIITFLGAPEKVISFPQIGYFDLPGPNGNIKTLVTPLRKEVDYFGNVKKPRLTMFNEKVKEKGGLPVHGSLFAVELEDGSLVVVQISGDSGVGKSEMLAAVMLKWLKKDLPGVRSLKMIAGDMFYVFPDKEGNLYGVGTEVGDFSRVTDFDPEYIRYYSSLFDSSADSNVEDLNSRSTISGLCDISMPFKIDIMLSASNFAREEAGIIRYDNPENFILYRESHGERKEKATSSDNPHIQRTLKRYTGDPGIVEVLDAYGNSLDLVFDWEKDDFTGIHYLCSSYKMIDKIDIEELANKIFKGQQFILDGVQQTIQQVRFDVIQNRFLAKVEGKEQSVELPLTRTVFGKIFNSLASTPSGQPFISEVGQSEAKSHLIKILLGAPGGKGKGKHIQYGVLSTDIGRPGKEITGPQKAAEDMIKMVRETTIQNVEVSAKKQFVRELIENKYGHLFNGMPVNQEVWRNNFLQFQFDEMRKADFVRLDDLKANVDLSGIKGFKPLDKSSQFEPLLLTPSIHIELSGFTETYEQLMSFPNNMEFAREFKDSIDQLYDANGYSFDTRVNNLILQLLLINGYISSDDLTSGRITEKVNRETLAAAKYSIIQYLNEKA